MSARFKLTFMTGLALAACAHVEECPFSQISQDAVTASLSQTFSCTAYSTVLADVQSLSQMSCETKREFSESLADKTLDPDGVDCAILKKRAEIVIKLGTPSTWSCSKNLPEAKLPPETCQGL